MSGTWKQQIQHLGIKLEITFSVVLSPRKSFVLHTCSLPLGIVLAILKKSPIRYDVICNKMLISLC